MVVSAAGGKMLNKLAGLRQSENCRENNAIFQRKKEPKKNLPSSSAAAAPAAGPPLFFIDKYG